MKMTESDKNKSLGYFMSGVFRKMPGISLPARLRRLAFLAALTLAMTATVVIFLSLSGILPADRKEAVNYMEKQFSQVRQGMDDLCGDTVLRLIHLSESLSKSVEGRLLASGVPVSALSDHPELLEEILSNELVRLQFSLDMSKCTGAFMILDATVNPNLADARHSKAGLYISIPEPRTMDRPDHPWLYYRGPSAIAYANNLIIQKLWETEFTVEGGNFFHLPIEAANTASLPLSKLYYWGMGSIIPGMNKPTLMCSIPLIDSNGNPFGVCGFEISEWNFRSQFATDDEVYADVLAVFGEAGGHGFITETALYAGKATAVSGVRNGGLISFSEGGGLSTYQTETGLLYMGLHGAVNLYHSDSVLGGDSYIISLMINKDELDAAAARANLRLLLVCFALLLLGVVFSVFINKKYLQPIIDASENLVLAAEKREQELIADNEMLDRLNRMKNEFLRNMSHDYKTPLTVIGVSVIDAADMLDYEIDKDRMRRVLGTAENEVMRMARMVDSAMKYSSMQDSRQYMLPLDLASLLREGAETYRALLERNGNTLILDIPESLPPVFGNNDILLHVLSNVLSNANRYTRGGEISVSAAGLGDRINVVVRDNGTGVKPELLPNVFERGVSDGGTGLGLSICKSAIEAHNGTITIESEYGQGTTVMFTLPVYIKPDKEEGANE